MSRFRFDDDVFSPVRLDASTVDTSGNSEENLSDISNAEITLSFNLQNKDALHDDVTKSRNQNELELKCSEQNTEARNSEYINICTSATNKNSSNLLDTKKFPSCEKLDSSKDFKFKTKLKKEISVNYEYLQKNKSKQRENVLDSNSLNSDFSEQKHLKSSSRSASLLSKEELVRCTLKDTKGEKRTSQSSKSISNINAKSHPKFSSEKKLIDSSLDVKKNTDVLKNKDSSRRSIESEAINISVVELGSKSNDLNVLTENAESTSNPPVSQYEASVEKMVRHYVSFECDKIRQNIYAQQMSFYRQINKIREEIERPHVATTERLFKLIEEQMQINAILKQTLLHVKNEI